MAAAGCPPAAVERIPAAAERIPPGVKRPPPGVKRIPPGVKRPPEAVERIPPGVERLPEAVEGIPPGVERLPEAVEGSPPGVDRPPEMVASIAGMRNKRRAVISRVMETGDREPRVFLLSPASPAGVRADQLTSPRAGFEAARRYRSPGGVAIDEAFTFMSSLYFRGKIAYARHFAAPPAELAQGTEDDGILVIAPGFGLVPPGWRLTPERMKKLRATPIDLKNRAYCEPLCRHAEQLREAAPGAGVVLLGSVATGKYVDLLLPVFGDRLLFPRDFAGAGDMKRGGMLLRAVREDSELDYVTLDAPRRRARA